MWRKVYKDCTSKWQDKNYRPYLLAIAACVSRKVNTYTKIQD